MQDSKNRDMHRAQFARTQTVYAFITPNDVEAKDIAGAVHARGAKKGAGKGGAKSGT